MVELLATPRLYLAVATSVASTSTYTLHLDRNTTETSWGKGGWHSNLIYRSPSVLTTKHKKRAKQKNNNAVKKSNQIIS